MRGGNFPEKDDTIWNTLKILMEKQFALWKTPL